MATSKTCVSRRKLGVESLEARRLLAFGGYVDPTLDSFATQQVRNYRDTEQPEPPPLQAGLSNFASELEMQAAFESYAAEYWGGLLGEEIVREKPRETQCFLIEAKEICNLYFERKSDSSEPSRQVWSVNPSAQTLSAGWTELLQDGNENPELQQHTEGGFL
ncbi:MAG: hypothetical protein AAF394_00330 [Planctomycetota bacterium]